LSDDKESIESKDKTNVLCRYAVASILLMIYMMAQGNIGWSAVYFTLATVLYALDTKKRPGRLSLV
jgi:hypothetical protein